MDPTQSLQELPIMHISATHNNTMATITDHLGKTLAWTSAVRLGASPRDTALGR